MKILELIHIEEFVERVHGRWPGRPEKNPRPLAQAFVAKAMYGFATTRTLLEALVSTARAARHQ